MRRQRSFGAHVASHAVQGIQPAADEMVDGYADVVQARIDWTEANRALLE